MTEKMLEAIGQIYPLTEKDCGEFAKSKVNGMKFLIRAFEARGLGNVSMMSGTAMFGMMKMDTVIINPFEKDMALFSYDRIYAVGNDTIFLELYDTRIEKSTVSDELSKVVAAYSDIPEEPVAPNWYDDIKLPESIKKKGKKAITPRIDNFTVEYLEAYLKLCADAKECDRTEKMKAAQVYTEGLLSNGGPSTDQFVKSKGLEFTQKLFRTVLFGTGPLES